MCGYLCDISHLRRICFSLRWTYFIQSIMLFYSCTAFQSYHIHITLYLAPHKSGFRACFCPLIWIWSRFWTLRWNNVIKTTSSSAISVSHAQANTGQFLLITMRLSKQNLFLLACNVDLGFLCWCNSKLLIALWTFATLTQQVPSG